MRDLLGDVLTRWRTRVVLPHVRGRLLDIGCGPNHLVRTYGADGVGVDVYQWGEADLIIEDAGRLPFPDGAFDTVTVIATLNHIPNRLEVLREARRVLACDGNLIVTMIPPLISRVWHALRSPWDNDQRVRGMKDGEVYGLRPGEVRRMLWESGFAILRERRFMLGLNRLTLAGKKAG